MTAADLQDLLDRTLAAYLSDAAEQARVLWIGSSSGGGPAQLAHYAETVNVLDPRGQREAYGGVRVSRLRHGRLSLQDRSYELIVVPDRDVFADDCLSRIDELRDALTSTGSLVVGSAAPLDEDDYRTWCDELTHRFPSVRLFGQGPFHGYVLSALTEDDEIPEVVVDGQLVRELESPNRLLAVCGKSEHPSTCVIVQTGLPEPSGDPTEELSAVHAHAEELEGVLDGCRSEMTALRRELQETEEEYRRDIDGYEDRLRGSGNEARELRAEIDRRGMLMRDFLEAVRDAREEAARDLLTEAGVREARLSGAIRGLQSRARELEALRDTAEERLVSLRETLRATEQERTRLEREYETARLKFAEEIDRLRSGDETIAQRLADVLEAEARLEDSLAASQHRVAECREHLVRIEAERDDARAENLRLMALANTYENRIEGLRWGYEQRLLELESKAPLSSRADRSVAGELAGLRMRLADRSIALEGHRQRSETSTHLAREYEHLRADLAQRDALVLRLQMDLAQEESANRGSEAKIHRLLEEVENLRGALLEASEAVDEAAKMKSDLEAQLHENTVPSAEAEERARYFESQYKASRETERKLRSERDQALRALRETRGILNALSVGVRNQPPAAPVEVASADEERQTLTEIHRRLEEARSGEIQLHDVDVVEALSELVSRLDQLDGTRAHDASEVARIKNTVATVKSGLQDVLGIISHQDEPAIRRIGLLLQLLDRV